MLMVHVFLVTFLTYLVFENETMVKRKWPKRTNNDLKNITHNTKDQATGTPLKTGDELGCSGRVAVSSFLLLAPVYPICNLILFTLTIK
jgi:hypothetical protein